MTVSIPLSKNLFALVDDDFEWLLQWQWHASGFHAKTKLRYAQRSIREDGKRRLIYMHRVITCAEEGFDVRHRDYDGLNNQMLNLKVCRHADLIGGARRPVGASGYRGVTRPNPTSWVAQITERGAKRRSLGTFRSAEDAARAYDEAALAAWGEFAVLNFPDEARP